MALKIRCKSSLEYMGTLIAAAGALATRDFVLKGLTGWSDNLSPDLKDEEESKEATEGAMKGVTEGRSQRRRPWPQIEVILELISSENTLPNGLADVLDIEKLEL